VKLFFIRVLGHSAVPGAQKTVAAETFKGLYVNNRDPLFANYRADKWQPVCRPAADLCLKCRRPPLELLPVRASVHSHDYLRRQAGKVPLAGAADKGGGFPDRGSARRRGNG